MCKRITLYSLLILGTAAAGCSNGSVGLGSNAATSEAAFSGEIVPAATAVTQGSFTVWTNPEHPHPHENYNLYTQIKLPAYTKSYSSSDLIGAVSGTDGFRVAITGASVFARFSNALGKPHAILSMNVPGAENGVKDTIQLHSKLLGESQRIVLTFGASQR